MTPGEHLASVVTDYRMAIELAAGAIRIGRFDEALGHLQHVQAPGRLHRSWDDDGASPLPVDRPSVTNVVEIVCDDCDTVLGSFETEWAALLWETEAGSLCSSCVGSSVGRALL